MSGKGAGIKMGPLLKKNYIYLYINKYILDCRTCTQTDGGCHGHIVMKYNVDVNYISGTLVLTDF